MKIMNTFLFSVGLIVIVLLVSCQLETGPVVAISPTTTAAENVQPTTNSPTVLVAATATTAGLDTALPISTSAKPTTTTVVLTPSASQTPLPEETLTPTPWPTLPPDEAANRVLSLLHDNHNPDCLLPCWWGAVPGQIYWYNISSYLESFALKIDFFPEESVFVAMFPVTESINYRGKLNIGYKLNTSEIVSNISIASINIEGYDPRTMMTIYGIPDEVWLKTFSEILPGEVLPFQLIIVYQKQGISFHYYVNATTDGETVTTCFEPGVVETERPDLFPAGPRIYLWEPGLHKTINEIADIPEEIYYPLEEKTDMTLQTFYERFTDPNERPCIDTPADLWE
jgi:hypothetical protein